MAPEIRLYYLWCVTVVQFGSVCDLAADQGGGVTLGQRIGLARPFHGHAIGRLLRCHQSAWQGAARGPQSPPRPWPSSTLPFSRCITKVFTLNNCFYHPCMLWGLKENKMSQIVHLYSFTYFFIQLWIPRKQALWWAIRNLHVYIFLQKDSHQFGKLSSECHRKDSTE